jgi:ribosome-binding factor A
MKQRLPYDRASRLADQIYRLVSTICYTELSDPRLEGIQITQVRMTKDLRTARVYFHIFDADPARVELIARVLRQARGIFKRAIGEEVQLKYMPELEFFYDETADVKEHIDELFEGLDRERNRERGG